MINYKHLKSVSLSLVESPLQAAGFSARPSIRRPRHCAGSGLARKYKMGLRPYRRWCCHPDETREYFTATVFHRRYLKAVFTDRVRKLGRGFVWLTQPFSWPPCVFIFYYFFIIKLFSCYCLICTHFTFIFTKFAHQSC